MSFSSSPGRLALKGAALLLLLPAAVTAQMYNKTIQTTYGPVQGYKYFTNQTELEYYFGADSSNVAAFLGIPFAASTAYENRWKAPQPRESWNETLIADSWGAACPSADVTSYSEDCLNLNIWTSANSSQDKLPVIVWNQGSDETSNDAWWYGGGMSQKHDVTVVTFNRRDDAFGFLAHPELNAESLAENGHNSSGNYGILDHLEVLKWVQKNIANFGGDPDRVTVAGQSFGSSQVYHAVNSALFKGTFVGAIAESGIRYPYDTLVAGLATSYVNMSSAIRFGVNYTEYHNVSTVAELRTLPVESLLDGSQVRVDSSEYYWVTALSTDYPLMFKPVLDGYVLPERYIDQLLSGPANDVPLITGNARDESGAELTTYYTYDEYIYDCKAKYANLSDTYFKMFPAGNGSTTEASDAWRNAARETSMVSTWLYARDWVLHSNATSPIYTYLWDHAPPGQDAGAFHQSEIMYVLNALYANADTYPFTSADLYIGEIMSSYWANFARTGNPNLGGAYAFDNLTYWAPNNGIDKYVMRLGNGYGNITISKTEAHATLIEEYFAQQSPF